MAALIDEAHTIASRAPDLHCCYLGRRGPPRPDEAETDPRMMKREQFEIAKIYVPVKRRATLRPADVEEIAASILDKGLINPILIRPDGERFVLVEGLHRLEAAKALGETTIAGYLVQAAKF